MPHDFRWIEWNVEKIQKHGCTISEVEHVVDHPPRGYPQKRGLKFHVHGRGQGQRFVQVIYLIDPDGTLFVIHAMPLSSRRRRGSR